ncbi:MAG: adenylate/guanylate cyclase domain-containing protein [Geminicoccaceae bacterium]
MTVAGARSVPPERRQVAVLYADLVGFTALTAEIGAEAVQVLLDGFFTAVDTLIERHGGTIDKHIGDCVMALFGAPVARGDDVLRAVRAASAIVAAMPGISASVGRELRMHGGIAVGDVVASGGNRHGYTVTGDTVNLAARLADLAPPGEFLVSDAMHLVLGNLVQLEPLGKLPLQGFAQAQRAHRLVGLAEPSSLDAGLLIGREAELDQLNGLIGRLSATGTGGLVVIRGEAGVGKTRLVRELERCAPGHGVTAHAALVLDFGTLEARGVLPALTRKLLGENTTATGTLTDDALAMAVESGPIGPALKPFLSSLLGLSLPSAARQLVEATTVGERQRRLRDAFVQLARGALDRQPLLLIVEDVHWADNGTLGDLATLSEALADLPMLLVLTTRRDGDPINAAWQARAGNPRSTVLDLCPLTVSDAYQLAGLLLAGSQQDAIERCVARAQGNPLFLEQLARHLRERHDDAVPINVQTLIQARLDRLESADREVLRAASVLGQRFSLSALRSILDQPGYDPAMLIERLFLRPVPEGLLFAHALIRDAVYDLLLRAHRRDLHLRAAAFFAERDSALHAMHLDRAGDPEAPRAYAAAARQQAEAYRNEAGATLAQRGLDIAAAPAERYALASLVGRLQLDLGRAGPAEAAFTMALDLAGDGTECCAALLGLAETMRLSDRLDEALAHLDNAERVAGELGRPADLCSVHHLRGNILFPLGRVDECVREHSAALALARQCGALDLEARALGGLGDGEYMRGRMISAHHAFAQCCELARRQGLGRVEAANLAMVGFTRYLVLDLPQAVRDADAAIELAMRVGHYRGAIVAQQTAWMCALMQLDLTEAEARCREARTLTMRIDARRFEAENLLWVAEAFVLQGDREAASAHAEASLAVGRETAIGFMGPSSLGMLAWATRDAARRATAIAEGEALLASGAVGHNHLFFRRFAIEASLDAGAWDEADRHAGELARYTSAEPFPWADFFAERGRTLAAHGGGSADPNLGLRLQRLRDRAAELGLRSAMPALDASLAQRAP